jgi:hypothetical protein
MSVFVTLREKGLAFDTVTWTWTPGKTRRLTLPGFL